MPPYKDGTYIVGKYVENLSDLKPNKTYVFVTANEGITYKRYRSSTETSARVSADNSFYEPYDIAFSDILEIWEYACGITTEEFDAEEFSGQNIKEMFLELKKDIKNIQTKL